MKLDHFAWSAPSLDDAVDVVEAWSGVRAAPGGSHPGMERAMRSFRWPMASISPSTRPIPTSR